MQAHSRQASDASSASHSVLSSPEASRDKPARVLSDSHNKASHKLSATLPVAINLDELYAKVNKNKSPEFPKIRKKGNKPKQHDTLPSDSRRVFSMDWSNVDKTASLFSYARNSALYDAMPSSSSPGIPELTSERNFKFVDSNDEMPDSDDSEPNYESLKKTVLEPGYETIKFSHECESISDPDYEILHASNQSDHGYESVSKQARYSKIKGLHSSTSKDLDPPYEGIRERDHEPPYEGIIGCEDEPPYEGIIRDGENASISPEEPPYEGICETDDIHCPVSSDGPPYEGLKPLFVDGIISSVVDENYEDESDPMYEGIKCNAYNSSGDRTRSNPSVYMQSDSSEGEYERIANNVEASDGSEPGYETVKGGEVIQEPAYETLKPRRYVAFSRLDDCTSHDHQIASSSVSAGQYVDDETVSLQVTPGRSDSPSSMSNL